MLKQPDNLDDRDRFWRALEQQLGEASIREGIGPHLRPALRAGAAMLLLDGLDEISATPDADGISLRARVSRAVQAAVRDLPPQARVVLTCRVLPYEQPPAGPRDDWTLAEDEGWVVRRLQPFAFGQVRRFVERWYAAACEHEHAEYSAEQGRRRAANLIAQLEHNPRLRTLVASPLLLTMLAILHYNKTAGELPRDRALLYDESVRLLLDRWEPQRTPGAKIPGLLERLGIAHLTGIEDLRAVLHRVAFTVHRQPPDPDHGCTAFWPGCAAIRLMRSWTSSGGRCATKLDCCKKSATTPTASRT
jgi:predicted NACHT family NTPase